MDAGWLQAVKWQELEPMQVDSTFQREDISEYLRGALVAAQA